MMDGRDIGSVGTQHRDLLGCGGGNSYVRCGMMARVSRAEPRAHCRRAATPAVADKAGSDVFGAVPMGQPVAMQIGGVRVEPPLGALDLRIEALYQPREPRWVVELDEMGDLVRGEIVEHERRRENKPPRERE